MTGARGQVELVLFDLGGVLVVPSKQRSEEPLYALFKKKVVL